MVVQVNVLSHTRAQHAIGIQQHLLDIQFDFQGDEPPTEVRDFFLAVDSHIQNVFDGIFAEEKVQNSDRVGIAIDFEGDAGRTFYKCAKYSNDPLRQLFNSVSKVLQSNASLMMRVWHIEVQIIRDMRGGARKRPFSHEANRKMRSTITIVSNDNLCLWRAVVVVLAYQEKEALLKSVHANPVEIRKNWRAMIRPNSGVQGQKARAQR